MIRSTKKKALTLKKKPVSSYAKAKAIRTSKKQQTSARRKSLMR